MTKPVPPGYFRDPAGHLKRERRDPADRRKTKGSYDGPERRADLRRHADSEIQERELDQMIDEALEEFAADHQH